MVVIIGPNWANDVRLQNPEDLHRQEIRTAIERGIQIVPVLVNGATMPRKEELRRGHPSTRPQERGRSH